MKILWISFVLLAALGLEGCAVRSHRPCSAGGEPSREKALRGTKQCYQTKDSEGRFVNNGLYREWHPNGQLATDGEYKAGRKHSKWTEWDEKGNRTSEKYYEDGKEVPPPR